MRGGRCRRGAMSESSIGAAADFAVENGREIGCVGMTIPTCFHDERGPQTVDRRKVLRVEGWR